MIEKVIKARVESLFSDLAKEFKLKTGDISPEQAQIVDSVEEMIIEWINQNIKMEEK